MKKSKTDDEGSLSEDEIINSLSQLSDDNVEDDASDINVENLNLKEEMQGEIEAVLEGKIEGMELGSLLEDSKMEGIGLNLIVLKKLDSEKKFVQSGIELINYNFKEMIDEQIKNEIKTKSKRRSVLKYFQSDKRNGKRIVMLSRNKSFFKPKNKLKNKLL